MMTTMPQPVRLRFTVDDYYKMIELGILKDYERAEIIEVHTKPNVRLYQFVKIYKRGEMVEPESIPNLSLNVDVVLS